MKLLAKETIQYGENGQTAKPGETFEIDEKKYPDSVEQLLESGHAAKPGTKEATTSSGDKKTGPLPDDFPGRAALAEAKINTYAQLRAAGDPTTIPGIGEATAEKIAEAMKD
jgi:hypothetical protein